MGRLQLALLHRDDVDQAIHADSSVTHVPFELLDGVHAENLSNRPPTSCASFSKFGNFRASAKSPFSARLCVQNIDNYLVTVPVQNDSKNTRHIFHVPNCCLRGYFSFSDAVPDG